MADLILEPAAELGGQIVVTHKVVNGQASDQPVLRLPGLDLTEFDVVVYEQDDHGNWNPVASTVGLAEGGEGVAGTTPSVPVPGTAYTAGNGIDITGNVISATLDAYTKTEADARFGQGYADAQAVQAAAAALVAANAQHVGIQASIANGLPTLTVTPAAENITMVFPTNIISTGELPIVYTRWAGRYLGYEATHMTAAPEIKINGVAVTAFPITLNLGDIIRVTATAGGTGMGILTFLHA